MQAVAVSQIVQPAYAPALNPVERLFEELRRAIEGRGYPTLQDKQHALALMLQAWQANPASLWLTLKPARPGTRTRFSIILNWY